MSEFYSDKLTKSEKIIIRLLLLMFFSVLFTFLIFNYIEEKTKITLSYIDVNIDKAVDISEEDKAEITKKKLGDSNSFYFGEYIVNLYPPLKIVEYLKYNIYTRNNVLLDVPSKNIRDAETFLRTDINKEKYPNGDNYTHDIGVGYDKKIYDNDIYIKDFYDASVEFSFVLSNELYLPDDGIVISCRDKSFFYFFIRPTIYSWLALLFVVAGGIYAFLFVLSRLFGFIVLGSPFYEVWYKFNNRRSNK